MSWPHSRWVGRCLQGAGCHAGAARSCCLGPTPRPAPTLPPQRFKRLVEADPRTAAHFSVPAPVPDLSAERVLTSERVAGVHIDAVAEMGQDVRDAVGTRLLALTLQELFEWRYMQASARDGAPARLLVAALALAAQLHAASQFQISSW